MHLFDLPKAMLVFSKALNSKITRRFPMSPMSEQDQPETAAAPVVAPKKKAAPKAKAAPKKKVAAKKPAKKAAPKKITPKKKAAAKKPAQKRPVAHGLTSSQPDTMRDGG
jgi:hypothetical protein